ncbi:MAG: tRNA (adenosine(37)-N6)-threonylcarbamoyltransferase complex transferase subunit TsaD, partial [Candidatus Auribacterota bacterium]|nr:tRNA (adenosine(37)-N6)-threonylcarbamoyltransferase complex transferase subunit TsaD [Candidatus Auribacterota bacterium]
KRLVVGGGVSRNKRLREKFCCIGRKEGIEIFFPPPELCTDNAAMVAGIGFELLKKGKCGLFNPDPNLKL